MLIILLYYLNPFPTSRDIFNYLAESTGFEPVDRFTDHLFSKQAYLASLTTLLFLQFVLPIARITVHKQTFPSCSFCEVHHNTIFTATFWALVLSFFLFDTLVHVSSKLVRRPGFEPGRPKSRVFKTLAATVTPSSHINLISHITLVVQVSMTSCT